MPDTSATVCQTVHSKNVWCVSYTSVEPFHRIKVQWRVWEVSPGKAWEATCELNVRKELALQDLWAEQTHLLGEGEELARLEHEEGRWDRWACGPGEG